MTKWTIPEHAFTREAKIIKAMQKHNLTVDDVLEAIEVYADNKQFEADLYKAYLTNDE